MGSLLKQFMAGVGGGNPWLSYWAQQIKTSSDVNDAIMTEDEESFIVSEETVEGNVTLYYLQTE